MTPTKLLEVEIIASTAVTCGHISDKSVADSLRPQFTRRGGNPGAMLTLARGLPQHLHISSIFTQHVYKARRASLVLG